MLTEWLGDGLVEVYVRCERAWAEWHEIEDRDVIFGRRLSRIVIEEKRQVCLINEQAIEERIRTLSLAICALGVVAYEMLTLQKPFTGENAQELFAKIEAVADVHSDIKCERRDAWEPPPLWSPHALCSRGGATHRCLQVRAA